MLLLLDRFARDYLKPAQLFFGILPAVRFDQTDHDVGAVVASGLRGLQHFIGFPDTGGGAQEYLQAAVAHFTGITHSFVTHYFHEQAFFPEAAPHTMRSLWLWIHALQREIQIQNVHARLAEDAETAAGDLAAARGCPLARHRVHVPRG